MPASSAALTMPSSVKSPYNTLNAFENAAIGLPAASLRAFGPIFARAVLNEPLDTARKFHVNVLVPRPVNRVAVTPLRLWKLPVVITSLNTTWIPVTRQGKSNRVEPIRLYFFVPYSARNSRTVGPDVSMTMFLLAASDPAVPGAGSVGFASWPPESLIVPPFRISADVEV